MSSWQELVSYSPFSINTFATHIRNENFLSAVPLLSWNTKNERILSQIKFPRIHLISNHDYKRRKIDSLLNTFSKSSAAPLWWHDYKRKKQSFNKRFLACLHLPGRTYDCHSKRSESVVKNLIPSSTFCMRSLSFVRDDINVILRDIIPKNLLFSDAAPHGAMSFWKALPWRIFRQARVQCYE